MDEAARENLAQRLTEMDLRNAVREMRNIDRDANMAFWRNSIWDEFHTLFLMPNEEIQVTLVEHATTTETDHVIGGGPSGLKSERKDYEYVEARVEPLERPARKRGGTGPSPLKRVGEQSS